MNSRKMSGEYKMPESISGFVAELANDLPFKKILDPACGNAGLLASVASRKRGIEVVGVDMDKNTLSQAEDTLKKAVLHFQLINADFFSALEDKLGDFEGELLMKKLVYRLRIFHRYPLYL